MSELGLKHFEQIVLWGFVSTAALTTILHGSQGIGWSRLSLSFLAGTILTGDRHRAHIYGFLIYLTGGWLFAFLYFLIFVSIGRATWWLGMLLGLLHALFLLTAILPLLPHLHPRMATEYDGPTVMRRLEPPGFLGLNYGEHTPITTIIGHAVYGMILGACYSIP